MNIDDKKDIYSDVKGIGPLSSLIFGIITLILMWLTSKFMIF